MNTRAADWLTITSAPAFLLYVLADPGIVRRLNSSLSESTAKGIEMMLFCISYFVVWWIIGKRWDRAEQEHDRSDHPINDADRPPRSPE